MILNQDKYGSHLKRIEYIKGVLSPGMRVVLKDQKCRMCGGVLELDMPVTRPTGKLPENFGCQFWCRKCGHGLVCVDADCITVSGSV